jgi:hypothetical protein
MISEFCAIPRVSEVVTGFLSRFSAKVKCRQLAFGTERSISINLLMRFLPTNEVKGNYEIFIEKTAAYLVNLTDTAQIKFQTSHIKTKTCTLFITCSY